MRLPRYENFLRDQNITELRDPGVLVPSQGFSEVGTGVNTTLVTLLCPRTSTAGLTPGPALPLYFSEVLLTPTEGTNLALYDLYRVQVRKGRQGTLFGRHFFAACSIQAYVTARDKREWRA